MGCAGRAADLTVVKMDRRLPFRQSRVRRAPAGAQVPPDRSAARGRFGGAAAQSLAIICRRSIHRAAPRRIALLVVSATDTPRQCGQPRPVTARRQWMGTRPGPAAGRRRGGVGRRRGCPREFTHRTGGRPSCSAPARCTELMVPPQVLARALRGR